MKNLILTWCFTLISVCLLVAQPPKLSTLKIQTSAVCGMCETTISKALYALKGVKKVQMDMDTKVITVGYNAKQVQAAAIRTAISNAGYDADNVIADPAAYDKLHACCKKDSKH
jgi:copper chaperone CopZ